MRVFLFTHWYPPNSTAPAFRAQSWVEGFSKIAKEVIVITPYREGNEAYPAAFHNQILIEERKGNIRIFRLPLSHHPLRSAIARMPNSAYRRFLMGLFYLLHHKPVHHSFDLDFEALESKLPLPQSNDWVLSSGPPFVLHRLALRWKMMHGCKWVADYRDLWTFGRDRFHWGWLREWWQERVDGEWERHWLHLADRLVTVGPTLAADLQNLFPKVDVSVLENGAQEDMKQLSPPQGGGNRWLYVGNLYPAQKSIWHFFSLLDDAIRQDGLDIELRFLGSNHYGCLDELFAQFPFVAQHCKSLTWQNRPEILEHYNWSNGCIHFPYEGAEGIPSAKRNEYACSGRKTITYSNQSKQEVLDWAKSTDFPEVPLQLFRQYLVDLWIVDHVRSDGN
ncbi:MAG: hypothetical protein RIS99_172 [Bacteroidota bacterium]